MQDGQKVEVGTIGNEGMVGLPVFLGAETISGQAFTQMAQSLACNNLHNIEQRCARWLLMTQDRVRSAQFPLTQQFLAQMLGVRRAGVSEVASRLQQEGLIQSHRGLIMIVNREGLEAVSCEWYATIKQEYDRLLGAEEPPRG
jgi:hypothetical protein